MPNQADYQGAMRTNSLLGVKDIYACYIQGALPGSELKDLTCPYPNGSKEAKEFAAGEFTAMMDAQEAT